LVFIGTSGFSYKDWVGRFYPERLPQSRWLEYYASEFDTCELNYTFYRLPTAEQLRRMCERVPEGFHFSLKAYRGITHEREDLDGSIGRLREALEPLKEEGKLGALVFQFPFSFRPGREAVGLLEQCSRSFSEVPAVVEFRNDAWMREQAFDLLRQLGLGFCCVDMPELPGLPPPVAVATSRVVGYVRLHGRNARKWWRHEHAWERYDYTYSAEELMDWVPKIRALEEATENTYVYANNHWQGQSVDTARQLRLLLESSSS